MDPGNTCRDDKRDGYRQRQNTRVIACLLTDRISTERANLLIAGALWQYSRTAIAPLREASMRFVRRWCIACLALIALAAASVPASAQGRSVEVRVGKDGHGRVSSEFEDDALAGRQGFYGPAVPIRAREGDQLHGGVAA